MRTWMDPRRVSPELRARYDVRGPRYTSYPPANHFAPVDLDELVRRYAERNELGADDPGLSLYLHVLYCKRRCLFCGCHSEVSSRPEVLSSYVDDLLRELDVVQRYVSPARVVRQIALGGGTPNHLPEADLDRLLGAVHERWHIADDAELSAELDPRTATPAKLDIFLDHGVNRISLGVQDFAPEVVTRLRQGQDSEQVEAVIDHLRARGVAELNLDLIFGLPGQTSATMAATAERLVELRPTRVALYSYAHVPWLRPQQKVLERWGLPDPDAKAALFLQVADALAEAGYVAVGMDHFALPDDPLVQALEDRTLRRSFMGYTAGRGLDVVGLGVSAISSVGSTYAQDHKDLGTWRERVHAGELPIQRGHLLSREDEIRRELIMELFCTFQVDLSALSERWREDVRAMVAPDLDRLVPLRDDGLVTWDADTVSVPEAGRFFIRNVTMAFDAWLGRSGTGQVYSRTV